jgi:hypothetical protein
MEKKTTEEIIREKSRIRLEGEQIIGTLLYNKDEEWVRVADVINWIDYLMKRCDSPQKLYLLDYMKNTFSQSSDSKTMDSHDIGHEREIVSQPTKDALDKSSASNSQGKVSRLKRREKLQPSMPDFIKCPFCYKEIFKGETIIESYKWGTCHSGCIPINGSGKVKK